MKHIYFFDEGRADMKDLLGNKGAHLAEMQHLGLPVPPGFIISTAACTRYLSAPSQLPKDLMSEVQSALKKLEKAMDRNFGDAEKPLLVSVRSGAPISMPGMLETVLNLGLNDQTVEGLAKQTGNDYFAYDCYKRFIQMFATVVLEINPSFFQEALAKKRRLLRLEEGQKMPFDGLQVLIMDYKRIIQNKSSRGIPQEPMEQLEMAIESVFRSWNIPRAVAYRNYMKIDHNLCSAVTVQAMVFGNLGEDSATGVAFTRNPATGERGLYGEFLLNAQGEDLVAGIQTPRKIAELSLALPDAYRQLKAIASQLEEHYKEMQDIEFTVERNQLFMLQTRTGKRTIQAAVNIAVDMANEGVISAEEALLRIDANQLPLLLLPGFNALSKAAAIEAGRLLATGLNASPGSASGQIVFTSEEAVQLASQGQKVILVRPETCPDDVHGMIAAQGILTEHGGNTSHAAVVARGMGKPCVTGCESCQIDLRRQTLTIQDRVFHPGDIISIDGATGEVFEGTIDTTSPVISDKFITLMQWADAFKGLEVRANAETPIDARKALELGAKGIGLCRTEHMFMSPERLPIVQQMILAENADKRAKVLSHLLQFQTEDFREILQIMAGYPVTIRLLDPPLHEFLPKIEDLEKQLEQDKRQDPYQEKVKSTQDLLEKARALSEVNPMMGFRGCRLGLLYPEIYQMQVQAIFEAACELASNRVDVRLEIMIPLVGHAEELRLLRESLESTANEVMRRHDIWLHYLFGTMIEVPRAALTADQIARYAEFFSFGTNDLTQLALGYSRDDAETHFLKHYLSRGILKESPFETLDTDGVGQLMQMAIAKGRSASPNIKLGLCGEHGGEAKSVKFCHEIGLDYISCSPFRVPTARLAAAQAAILEHPKTGHPKTRSELPIS